MADFAGPPSPEKPCDPFPIGDVILRAAGSSAQVADKVTKAIKLATKALWRFMAGLIPEMVDE